MNLSINPTYFCNFRCNFCYLTNEQLGDTLSIAPEKLDELLSQVPTIDHVDFYGGEIGTMRKEKFYAYKEVIRKYYKGSININTNFSMMQDYFFDDDITLSVSYDFEAREKADLVFQNMMKSPKDLAVLILASPKVLEMDVEMLIRMLNFCGRVISVEIKPYSTNQANSHNVTHKDFEEFVKKWFDYDWNFSFTNQRNIENSLDGKYNAFSDDHIYITPSGKFGVLEFDKDDKEYFLELDKYNDYIEWTKKEKEENVSEICRNCEYFGKCLTEHYRYVNSLENSCNGYKGLLDWY